MLLLILCVFVHVSFVQVVKLDLCESVFCTSCTRMWCARCEHSVSRATRTACDENVSEWAGRSSRHSYGFIPGQVEVESDRSRFNSNSDVAATRLLRSLHNSNSNNPSILPASMYQHVAQTSCNYAERQWRLLDMLVEQTSTDFNASVLLPVLRDLCTQALCPPCTRSRRNDLN